MINETLILHDETNKNQEKRLKPRHQNCVKG